MFTFKKEVNPYLDQMPQLGMGLSEQDAINARIGTPQGFAPVVPTTTPVVQVAPPSQQTYESVDGTFMPVYDEVGEGKAIATPATTPPAYAQKIQYPANPYIDPRTNNMPAPIVDRPYVSEEAWNQGAKILGVTPPAYSTAPLSVPTEGMAQPDQQLLEQGMMNQEALQMPTSIEHNLGPRIMPLETKRFPNTKDETAQYGESGTGKQIFDDMMQTIPGLNVQFGKNMRTFDANPYASLPMNSSQPTVTVDPVTGQPTTTPVTPTTPVTIDPNTGKPINAIPTVQSKGIPIGNNMPTIGTLPPANSGKVIPEGQMTPEAEAKDAAAQEQVRKGAMSPEQYYAFKATLDTAALMRNMIQQQPPNMQLALTHNERIRMDRTPYEQQRTDIERMGQNSYRSMREGISQASDLMKGVTAVTAATQENMRQVGTAEAQQALQVDQTNQQVAMQENAAQAGTMNQETQMNYQIQQQAQQFKDQMVSTQLGRIGDTAGAYANYSYMKEQADAATKLSKDQAAVGNDIQIAMMEYQLGKNELSSDHYKNAETSAWRDKLQANQGDVLGDVAHAELKSIYGDETPNYMSYADKMYDKNYLADANNAIQGAKYFEKTYPNSAAPTSTDYPDAKELANQTAIYNASKKYYDEYKGNPEYRKFELEHKYWTDVENKNDINAHKQQYADEYLRSKKMIGNADFAERLKGITSRLDNI